MFHGRIVELPWAVVMHLKGEADLAAALILREYLDEAAKSQKPILLDMTNLPYFDSSSVRVVEAFHQYALAHAWPVAIITPVPAVRRGLQLMGIDRQISIFGSIEEALSLMNGTFSRVLS